MPFCERALFSSIMRTGHDSIMPTACCTSACSVRPAWTTTTICPMCDASTRASVVSSSGGESKMMMRSG
jgi:hypothetical protein